MPAGAGAPAVKIDIRPIARQREPWVVLKPCGKHGDKLVIEITTEIPASRAAGPPRARKDRAEEHGPSELTEVS